jgi:adhesin transport system membrane fusion protein
MSSQPYQMRYLSQAVQLEEAVNPAIIRTTLSIISVAIIAFTVWSGFTNINEVARTPGEIIPSGHQQVVQHLEGGIVEKINIAEGAIVKKGDLLVILNGAGAKDDLARAQSRQTTLRLQEERLRAYIEKRKPDFSAFVASHPDLTRDQQRFFDDMRTAHNEEVMVIREQVSQKERMITTLHSELATARSNLTLAQQLYDRREELHEKGYLSDTKFLESEQSLNTIKGNVSQLQTRISVAQAEKNEFQNRLKSLGSGFNDQVNERLDAVLSEKNQNEELIEKLKDRVARLDVRAPVDGIIKGLAVNTLGAVVRPGDTIMEVVPTGENMVVQVKIAPQHIAHLKIGQDVKVKLSSYDFSRYGLVQGTLDQVSATTFSGEQGERYYQGKIKLDNNFVGSNPSNIISPGMTAMAEIITGRKTILQYLLKPIHNSLKTAFSER